ncbi:MAG: ATP-binding protein [Deltaproteobacteria bacterium]|jgi:AAA+ superfamily predicted ATPase|nr:ATP-binding protein [Deltaproteobacteria bacterium]
MARADLLKKLFSGFKTNDRDGFVKTANEIIEDERKKNHGALAEELRMILNKESAFIPKNMTALSAVEVKSNEKEREAPLYEIVYPEKTLSDIVITKDNRQKIERIIREFSNWDVLMCNGVWPTRRVLFYGPPGCGKTVTAGAMAAEIRLPLLYVRFDAIVSSYLGETAGNIRKVFDFANGDSYVMLFDEFDTIARSRYDRYEHGEFKRVVNTFLQQIDNFKGRSLVIAATNFERSLDYAVWRRFDSTLLFDMPDNNERMRLFNLKLKQFKGSESIITEFAIDIENFSHSDVEKAALDVIKQCILEGRRMYTKKDVEQAVTRQKELVSLRKTQYQAEE